MTPPESLSLAARTKSWASPSQPSASDSNKGPSQNSRTCCGTHARRTGVGSALISDSAAWAQSHGCRTLELVIAPNGTNADQLFRYYSHHNFTDEGRRLLSRHLTH
ncbi:GNAT family N-acetyltransferase [Mycobacterium sp. SMC-2]|uniref:GNAT family N-acetyltransferase n=1 Tax=Mycobacterium sp. SMC-2 TaxID=2857058 RepID=UPI0037C67D76